jgi:predicted MPP superfamily phosphohydrolase
MENPDLIVITGDTTADTGTLEMAGSLLSKLRAPLGVFAVRGNWEIWRRSPREQAFYESVGIKLLVNASAKVREGIWIAGFDDATAGKPDLDAGLRGVPPEAYTIALFHTPEFFDSIAGRCDLALAGHMHGGQVRLPWVGALWVPARDRRYVDGWYQRADSRMYVSRGVGTSVLNVRFNCRPEISIVSVLS